MFVIEAGPDVARVDSLREAQEWLRALTPGAEVTVRGLGRVVVCRMVRGVDSHPCQFYPASGMAPQPMLVEDVVAMLEDMVDPGPEEVPEELPEDPNVVQWRVVEYHRERYWVREEDKDRPRRGARKSWISAGREAIWAREYPVGTILTIRTTVEVQRPGDRGPAQG